MLEGVRAGTLEGEQKALYRSLIGLLSFTRPNNKKKQEEEYYLYLARRKIADSIA